MAKVKRPYLLFEPRDCWIGVYWSKEAVYIALVPMIVLRFRRRKSD